MSNISQLVKMAMAAHPDWVVSEPATDTFTAGDPVVAPARSIQTMMVTAGALALLEPMGAMEMTAQVVLAL